MFHSLMVLYLEYIPMLSSRIAMQMGCLYVLSLLPPTQKKTSAFNKSLISHLIKTNLPLSEFYQNSCLLTSPLPKLKKLESSLFLDNLYFAIRKEK